MSFDLDRALRAVAPGDEDARARARERHDALAKPPGSLGRLEALGADLAAIAGTCPPPVPHQPTLLVAAGDHGVHAEGVTPWPQDITTVMAGVIAEGGAASSVLADGLGVDLTVLEVGTAKPAAPHPRLRSTRVVEGTANLRLEDAMTTDEVLGCLAVGHDAAIDAIDAGADLLALGDMGIANTTASACLVASYTGASAREATGRGTGIDDAMLAHKQQVVADALDRLGPDREPLEVLAAVGGAEHAALAGVVLAAAARRVPVVLDGVITNAAALAAVALAPACRDHLVASHRSVEPAATLALDHLGLTPLLELDLRLGEGTGALLAVPIVQSAARVLGRMATLADLGA